MSVTRLLILPLKCLRFYVLTVLRISSVISFYSKCCNSDSSELQAHLKGERKESDLALWWISQHQKDIRGKLCLSSLTTIVQCFISCTQSCYTYPKGLWICVSGNSSCFTLRDIGRAFSGYLCLKGFYETSSLGSSSGTERLTRLAPKLNWRSSSQVTEEVGAGKGVCSGVKMKELSEAGGMQSCKRDRKESSSAASTRSLFLFECVSSSLGS